MPVPSTTTWTRRLLRARSGWRRGDRETFEGNRLDYRFSKACRDKGWTAAGKARVPLMLVGLMDVLHAFPGQIPDLDAVLSVADFPCVPMCVSSHTLTLTPSHPDPEARHHPP